jgi:uncharacterized protein YdaT
MMPWTMSDYPASMKNLSEVVKEKAIEQANKLVSDGYDDSRAIPIAIAQAKSWYDKRGNKVSNVITHHLKPKKDAWVLEAIDKDESWQFDTKKEAMAKMEVLSKKHAMKVMIHDAKGQFQRIY